MPLQGFCNFAFPVRNAGPVPARAQKNAAENLKRDSAAFLLKKIPAPAAACACRAHNGEKTCHVCYDSNTVDFLNKRGCSMKKTDFSFIFKIVLPLILIAVLVPVILIAGPDRKGKAPERQETAGSGSSSSSLAVTESDSSSLSGTSAREDSSEPVITADDITESVKAAAIARAYFSDPEDFWLCVPAYYSYLEPNSEKTIEDTALGRPCIALDKEDLDRVGRLLYADYNGYEDLPDVNELMDFMAYAYKQDGVYYVCNDFWQDLFDFNVFSVTLNDDGSADIELRTTYEAGEGGADVYANRVRLIKEYSAIDGGDIVRVQSVTDLD
jgi:stage V sporulation protein SpoVS